MDSNREVNNLVLYDGVCKFCNGAVNFILDHENGEELTFTPLQSELGQRLLKKYDFPIDYADSLLFVSHDHIFSHSSAAFKIAKYLKSPWQQLSFFSLLPTFITDFFYKLIAKHRYRLMGQSDACMVPTEANKSRFLE